MALAAQRRGLELWGEADPGFFPGPSADLWLLPSFMTRGQTECF